MMQEDEPTIRARLRLAPDSAWVVEDEEGVCAYLMCYRSTVGKVTPLNGLFEPATSGDALYLHDLAVSKRCKGRGAGRALAEHACRAAHAAGLDYAVLVSVQGSKEFWQRLGFAVWDGLTPAQAAILETYEGPAIYMVRQLSSSLHR